MPRIRKPEDIQADIDALEPEVVAALKAQKASNRAADIIIGINSKNYAEYSSRQIRLNNLYNELIEAKAAL